MLSTTRERLATSVFFVRDGFDFFAIKTLRVIYPNMSVSIKLSYFQSTRMEKMNSSTNYLLPAKRQTLPKILSNEKILRTRPPPNFLRVLVIDDKKSRGIANADMISGFGHAVELARDGITALRLAAANRPDAVLLNTHLRGPDEYDVARHLRSDFSEQPPLIIGLASHTNPLMRRPCVEAGMDMVLEVPLNAEAIETVLQFECAKLTVEETSDSSNRSRQRRVRIPANSLAVAASYPTEACQLLAN